MCKFVHLLPKNLKKKKKINLQALTKEVQDYAHFLPTL